MSFTSVTFFIFIPIILLVYFLLPYKYRYIWLLFCSYFFYTTQNTSFTTLLIISTITTWICGNITYALKTKATKNAAVAIGVIVNLSILAIFKYANFALSLFNSEIKLSLILPAGISFYTFQSITYIIDCYREECEPEHNIFKYALFVSFFPLILSGPIERAKNLLPKLHCAYDFDAIRAKDGLKFILYGYFLKMVIVARLNILTDTVFYDYLNRNGFAILIAILAYTIQIYCDFAGYSNIAVGICKIMGIDIIRNFRQPYFATSVADFWRRWHISLSTWFRDYLYIPLGGNRKGSLRKRINILIVFLLSGIWHGANITFVIWGLLNGIYQVVGDLCKPVKASIQSKLSGKSYNVMSTILTFVLISFTWVFFRASSVSEAFAILSRLTSFNLTQIFDGTVFTVGLGHNNLFFVILAIVILLVSDILCEKNKCDVSMLMANTKPYIRWAVYYVMIIMIILSCNLSTQEFIYQQF
ncbi:MAG: MBOAT family O-acyltransferase [Lachnospiraceae bacterium]|nr:MBOAT family O-acyltransferase [Lachnospiraceae bacterium]